MYEILYEFDFQAQAKQTAMKLLAEGGTPETADELAQHFLFWYDSIAAVVKEEVQEIAEGICCRVGCTHCCGLRIEASPPEIFLIATHLAGHIRPADRKRFTTKIQALAKNAAGMSAVEWAASEYVCPLLEQSRCAIYSARPLSCRGWSSMDVDWCRTAITQPETATQNGNVLTWMAFGIEAGLREALAESGLEGALVELNTGLDLVLRKPRARLDWLAGKTVFDTS